MSSGCDVGHVPLRRVHVLGEETSLSFRQQLLQVLDPKSISDSARYQDSLENDSFGECQSSAQAFQIFFEFSLMEYPMSSVFRQTRKRHVLCPTDSEGALTRCLQSISVDSTSYRGQKFATVGSVRD